MYTKLGKHKRKQNVVFLDSGDTSDNSVVMVVTSETEVTLVALVNVVRFKRRKHLEFFHPHQFFPTYSFSSHVV